MIYDKDPGPDKEATIDVVLSLELPVLEILFNSWFVLSQIRLKRHTPSCFQRRALRRRQQLASNLLYHWAIVAGQSPIEVPAYPSSRRHSCR